MAVEQGRALAFADDPAWAKITELLADSAPDQQVPEWVVDRWLELIDPKAFVFIYGSSERVGFAMMTGADWAEHRGSTGTAVDVDISIRDEAGRELPVGEIGEIHMRLADIDADNRVASSRVADARIEYAGNGSIQRAGREGWLSRFFNMVSPF